MVGPTFQCVVAGTLKFMLVMQLSVSRIGRVCLRTQRW